MNSEMRAAARARLGERELSFGLNHVQAGRENWDVFRRMVELGVEAGATHISVGTLPFRYGSWVLPDNDDPYSAWCVNKAAILRVCPPPEIQEWVDPEHAQWCRDFIHRQLEIIRPYGLKAISSSIEPMWLPEGVYRAHPRWRGAQCELGRIALAPYWAPSIDEPEVRDLYRRAMNEYCRLFPEIDFLEFMSNDSGAGVAWTPCIYPGMNGPAAQRTKDGGQRIAEWLIALQEGAREAGSEVKINFFSSGFPAELKASTRAKLPPGIFISWTNDHGETLSQGSASLGSGLWHLAYPAAGMGDPEACLAGLQEIYHNPDGCAPRASISVHDHDIDHLRDLLQGVLDKPGAGRLKRTELALDAAARFCGSKNHAETLYDVWEQQRQAIHAIAQIRQKGFGHVLDFAVVSMRWLLRPLVPNPADLTADEKAHYRDFMFAAGDQKDDPDLGMVLGKSVFNGESVTWMTRWCLHEAVGTLRSARQRVLGIRDQVEDVVARKRLDLYAARLGALSCLANNARLCVMYKYALDTARQPLYGPNQVDYDDNIIYDQRALSLRKIAREELDNMTELIELIESQDEPVIIHATKPEEESVFMLPPDLVGALRRKMEIMLDHWQDYERMYPATKVHDFEPEPKGNLDWVEKKRTD